jgi:hypothetical protein
LTDVLKKRRDAFLEQNPFPVGWVLGPPGTEKSQHIPCLCLHLGHNSTFYDMDSCGTECESEMLPAAWKECQKRGCKKDLLENTSVGDRKHVVFVDGYFTKRWMNS